jgi:hypothetical protein
LISTPTVQRNGTAKDVLLEDFYASRSAIADAIHCLQTRGPNARDYYPQGGTAFTRAVEEHTARIHRLTEVLQEIDQIIEAVDRQ